MFDSFFFAGFDCTAGFNADRAYIDHYIATGHDARLVDDYALVAAAGIRAVREGVCWPAVQRNGRIAAQRLMQILDAANRRRFAIIFDLSHFGYPAGADVFSSAFADDFAEYCYRIATIVAGHHEGACYFTPINEPSYWAWAGGEAAQFAPFETGRGFELKVALVRAAIAGTNAIWNAAPSAQIISVDPVCRVAAPRAGDDVSQQIEWFNNVAVLESWDMLAGRLLPELGGSRRHLGVVGVNYYWTNQWEWGAPETPLGPDDERRCSLADLVDAVWRRYGGDILITETAHVGEHRAPWIAALGRTAVELIRRGVPLRGVCLYPILGMPAWHRPADWLRMGLWDVDHNSSFDRSACTPAIQALREAEELVSRTLAERRAIEGAS